MALPSSAYVAFQGIQTYFSDKDQAIALSGGYVEFYSWAADQSTPKDVYIQTRHPDNTYTFSSIGNTVTLNIAGAFSSPVDGTDVQVYGYVFEGDPDVDEPTTPELYHVRVYSTDGVLQFTRDAVPANAFSSSSTGSTFVGTDNEISNPQFVEVNFEIPSVTISVTGDNTVTNIAPDWDIITSGTGMVTLSQVPINELPLEGNPPYALGITSTSLTAGTTTLRQRFQGSPRLLLNSIINGSILVKSDINVPVPFTVTYITLSDTSAPDSFEIISAEPSTSDATFSKLSGTVNTESNTSSGVVAPSGYSELHITFTANTQVYITNVQLLSVDDILDDIDFIEQSTARQIDHLYHYAYPIVPIGTIIDFFGFQLPEHYLLCDYTAYNRQTYSQLFNTITTTETVTLNSTDTFTVADGTIYSVGYGVEGTGIPANATITGISGNDITISRAATVSTSQVLRFFAAGNQLTETVTLVAAPTPNPNQFTVVDISLYAVGMSLQSFGTGVIPSGTYITTITPGVAPAGTITMSQDATTAGSTVMYFFSPGNGDGSTTFNVPDARRKVMMGSGGTIISAPPLGIGNQLGNVGGEEAHTQLLSELVQHTHDPLSPATSIMQGQAGGIGAGAGNAFALPTTGGVTEFTTQAAFNIIQPSLITYKCIRYE